MDDETLVACGHCGRGNRRSSATCFICGRPLTGLEAEVVNAPPLPTPEPVPEPAPGLVPDPATPVQHVAETMTWGADGGGLPGEPRSQFRRRRTAIVAAAAALSVAVVAGVWMTRDSAPVSDPFALRVAITEEPELDWIWDAEKPIESVAPMGLGALVMLERREVVALDEDGEVRWRHEVPSESFAAYDAATDTVHVYVNGTDGSRVLALDPDTGQERWTVEGQWAMTADDVTVVLTGDEMRRVDTRDGSEIWTLPMDSVAGVLAQDAVYGFVDGDLHSWDLDGNERWVVDTDIESSHFNGASVVVLDDFVVAAGPGSDVIGIDSATGEELWRADPGEDGGGLGSLQPDFAYLLPADSAVSSDGASSDEASSEGADVIVYDKDGEVTTVPLLEDSYSYLYLSAIELDGAPHALDHVSGRIFDEDFEQVAKAPPQSPYSTLTGFYEADNDSLSYVPYGDTEPSWTLKTSLEGQRNLWPGDEFLLVTVGETLSLYR